MCKPVLAGPIGVCSVIAVGLWRPWVEALF